MGYVLRMSQLNHLQGMQWLCDEYAVERIGHLSRQHIPSIAWFFGQDPNQFHNSYVEKLLDAKVTRIHFYGHIISRPFLIRHRSPQICSKCLEEDTFIRQHWDISFVTSCTSHRIKLIDHCHGCTRKISWNRPGVFRCQCGFDFRISKNTSSSDEDDYVSTWLSNHLYGTSSHVINNAYPIFNSLKLLSLDGALRLFWATGIRATASDYLKAGESRKILSIDEARQCAQRSLTRMQCILQPETLPLIREQFVLSGILNLLDDFQKTEDSEFALHLLSLERNPNSQKASLLHRNPRAQLQLF